MHSKRGHPCGGVAGLGTCPVLFHIIQLSEISSQRSLQGSSNPQNLDRLTEIDRNSKNRLTSKVTFKTHVTYINQVETLTGTQRWQSPSGKCPIFRHVVFFWYRSQAPDSSVCWSMAQYQRPPRTCTGETPRRSPSPLGR